MPYPFLSEAWIVAAREVRVRYEDQTPAIVASVRANLNISEVPFGEGTLEAHLDTSTGKMELELGHLEVADVTLSMDYATAKGFVVNQDQAVIMQAVMAGKVRIQGDYTKLMAMATVGQSTGAADVAGLAAKVAEDIKSITE